jgi:hypothetical protein
MALTAEQILDLAKSVQTNYPFKGWTSVAQKQTEYIAFNQFFKGKKQVESGGVYLGFNVKYKYQDDAEFIGLGHRVDAQIESTMLQGQVPWRHVYNNYSYDAHEEAFNSRDEKMIFDVIKSRREDAWLSMAAKIEKNFWGDPASMTTSTDPYPLKYWLTMNSGADGGFDGNYHTSFTSKGGISSTTAARWRNWTDTYTSITESDLWAKLKEAMAKTKFMSPVPSASDKNTPPKRTICVSYATQTGLEDLVEQRNENLGTEAFYGGPTFKGTPLLYVPNLDSDNEDTPQSYDAVVGIDWSTFGVKILRGWDLKEDKPVKLIDQPYMVRADMTASYNTFCDNLRRCFVIGTNYAWSPSA